MTRDELIEALKSKARQLRILRSVNAGCEATGLGLEFAAKLAEQLDPPLAMAWQDEPSGDGWYFVENWPGKIFRLVASGGGWIAHEAGAWNAFDLEFRRVCPIPAPPPLPKRK